ncbi:MAG: hypothetical protein NC253_01640 [Ruminococcus sp.]|nr:hypothetical protein [Ruminococcus sp.]MCM1380737.1 hypothetical protein [Muribaculaceae bacterium]MCM1478861.1 hypothetical protein [Muribaculaceae bacterium]
MKRIKAISSAILAVTLTACGNTETETIVGENNFLQNITESQTETETDAEITAAETQSQTSSEQTAGTASESAPQTTEAQTESVSESSIQTSEEAVTWNETDINKTLYIKTNCYSQAAPIVDAESVNEFEAGQEVKIAAETDTGYYKLSDGTYIHANYTSDTPVTVIRFYVTEKEIEILEEHYNNALKNIAEYDGYEISKVEKPLIYVTYDTLGNSECMMLCTAYVKDDGFVYYSERTLTLVSTVDSSGKAETKTLLDNTGGGVGGEYICIKQSTDNNRYYFVKSFYGVEGNESHNYTRTDATESFSISSDKRNNEFDFNGYALTEASYNEFRERIDKIMKEPTPSRTDGEFSIYLQNPLDVYDDLIFWDAEFEVQFMKSVVNFDSYTAVDFIGAKYDDLRVYAKNNGGYSQNIQVVDMFRLNGSPYELYGSLENYENGYKSDLDYVRGLSVDEGGAIDGDIVFDKNALKNLAKKYGQTSAVTEVYGEGGDISGVMVKISISDNISVRLAYRIPWGKEYDAKYKAGEITYDELNDYYINKYKNKTIDINDVSSIFGNEPYKCEVIMNDVYIY